MLPLHTVSYGRYQFSSFREKSKSGCLGPPGQCPIRSGSQGLEFRLAMGPALSLELTCVRTCVHAHIKYTERL